MDLICRCGHCKCDHKIGTFSGQYYCAECDTYNYWHKFQLDNLRFLEKKVVEKGL